MERVMIFEAKLSLWCLAASLAWNFLVLSSQIGSGWVFAAVATLILLVHYSLYLRCTKLDFDIIWRAYILGVTFSIGMNILLMAGELYVSTGLYFCLLSFFHFSEYFATAILNPSSLAIDSFIINHSREYNAAMILSFVEHAIILYFIPGVKFPSIFTLMGLSLCVFGEFFRKLAMYTAGKNFTHIVQYYKRSDHKLVTDGVYSLVRHPSYTGWFCWSVGTQILLCNPVCFVGYTIASWKFFRDRIEYEEITLLNFFGFDYVRYKKNIPSGIPFVYGYQLKR